MRLQITRYKYWLELDSLTDTQASMRSIKRGNTSFWSSFKPYIYTDRCQFCWNVLLDHSAATLTHVSNNLL